MICPETDRLCDDEECKRDGCQEQREEEEVNADPSAA